MALTDSDKRFLEQAFQLAERGRGLTSPNPVVGAVVVLDGRAVGQGFHAGPGKDHAEIVAMKDVARAYSDAHLTGGTMVVTLEPCCHHGRTPPCTDALIRAGFSRVVVGAIDPSDRVNGRGIAQLRAAGIAVDLADGDLAYRMRRQNDAFRKHATLGLPFVTYKYAMTLDGRIATETGHSKWISGEESRARVQQERAWSDAVLVGAGTMRADNPRLTVRALPVLRQPLRVVVDPHLSIERSADLVRTAEEGPVLIVCSETASESRRAEVASWGLMVVPLPGGPYPDPVETARFLAAREVQSVLLEGGPTLAAAWWEAGLVDRVQAFVAPVMAGGAGAPGPLPSAGSLRMDEALRLRDVAMETVGVDVLVTAYLSEPA
jgi:diaminohydroxyphosphoribosylaminopyrimidine deaminase/5-amino-6-(5-phosphoribosylamino)uracil reductase